MKYDFTTILDRAGRDSLAADVVPFDVQPDPDVRKIPMWVADMSFPAAPPIIEAIEKRLEMPNFGYFSLPDSVEVAVADGRAFLSASDELFVVIMVDAYQDITIPFQLSSVEFFSEVSRHLKPEGVMVVNLNMTSRENGSLNEYLCDTMASVFKRTYIADVAGNTNTEVFCTNANTLEQTFDESRAKLTNARYAEMMATVAQRLTEYTGGSNILTDDKAPVELLGMRVLDELIAGELSYYKSNFSMDDIMGMLGA